MCGNDGFFWYLETMELVDHDGDKEVLGQLTPLSHDGGFVSFVESELMACYCLVGCVVE